jgi:DNA/RNA endonuclease G (NUC1)
MTPQYHALNAGDWEELEATTYNIAREKDSVHIWAGSLGVAKKIGTTSVPRKCWKVVYVKKTKELKAYVFINNLSPENGIEDNEVSIDVITKLTGFKDWNNIEK